MNKCDKNLILIRYAYGKEDFLIEKYIKDGPEALKDHLGTDDESFSVIFDHLVFEHNLLYKAVLKAEDFFVDEYVKYGISHVRNILDIEDSKYNLIFESCKDFILICHDGLYLHVLNNRDKYLLALKARGENFLRVLLNIHHKRYDGIFKIVFDVLNNSCADGMLNMVGFERGISIFNNIFNKGRECRPLAHFLSF
ncbi:MAG: hypothetical protein WC806_04255 [Candidatus Gracilibacteria bacterium]|jgi:hypothetical protein